MTEPKMKVSIAGNEMLEVDFDEMEPDSIEYFLVRATLTKSGLNHKSDTPFATFTMDHLTYAPESVREMIEAEVARCEAQERRDEDERTGQQAISIPAEWDLSADD